MKKRSRDAQAEQIEMILEQLEKGVAPWVKPWQTLGNQRNAGTGRGYNGGNAVYLSAVMSSLGYNTPLWVTAKQATALGGHVKGRKTRNGEVVQEDEYNNSWAVIWFRPNERTKLDSDGNPVLDDNGDEETVTSWMRGVQFVYNVEQTTIDPKKYTKLLPAATKTQLERNDEIEAFLSKVHKSCGFKLQFGGDRACYSSMTDRISVPELDRFKSSEDFYATQIHEFAHATGHKSRLNRPLNNVFGSKSYAEEELVAELTAAFVGADFQIDGQCQHPEYLANWFEAVSKDKRIFNRAASKAKKAADFLRKAAAPKKAKKSEASKKAA